MTAKTLLICEVILILLITTKTQDIGKECMVQKNAGTGVCVKAYSCEDNVKELGDDTACKNSGLTDVVCCPSENCKKFKRISEKKCADYALGSYDACGQRLLPLHFNATKAEINEFPYMAEIGFDGSNLTCSGSLISDMFVLTAAHIISLKHKTTPTYVRLGQIDKSSKNWEVVDIVEVIRHPTYRKRHFYHDIALLKLSRPVKFGPSIRPACLPTFENEEDSYAYVTGWGTSKAPETEGDRLKKAAVDMFGYDECEAMFPIVKRLPRGIDHETHICAGSKTDSDGTCTVKYGGTLQIAHHSQYCMYTVIGIASFGSSCGSKGAIDVYTKIFGHLSWIEAVVWPNK